MAVSLDGFIEGPNGELDWFESDSYRDEEVRYANEFLPGFDTIFYGRVAYEKFGVPRPIDPAQTEAEREFNNTVNNTRKYVFSRTLKHVAGNGMVINGNMEAEVKRIREEDGKDIWFCGGADILTAFVELDLVDEYVFVVNPVVLGSGKPLFQNIRSRLDLKLIKTQRLKSGVVVLHYRPEKLISK